MGAWPSLPRRSSHSAFCRFGAGWAIFAPCPSTGFYGACRLAAAACPSWVMVTRRDATCLPSCRPRRRGGMNAITPIEGEGLAECRQLPTDEERAERLESLAVDIEMTIQVAEWRVGRRLRDARDMFRYSADENGFEGWLKSRLGVDRSEAYRLISVSENLDGPRRRVRRVAEAHDLRTRRPLHPRRRPRRSRAHDCGRRGGACCGREAAEGRGCRHPATG